MNRIRTDILEIAFEEGGPPNGIPVLLLHGWPDAPRGWNEVARRLQADGFRTIAPFSGVQVRPSSCQRKHHASAPVWRWLRTRWTSQMPSVSKALPCWGTIGGRGKPTF